ncbi:MAG: hypothetical protein WA324_30460 [Bryobacteraceae bacterium]
MTTQSKQVPAFRRLRVPLLVLGFVAAISLWWLFRPELLFINQRVNETTPIAVATLQPIFTGSFRPLVGMQDTHGRVNIIDRRGGLQLEITNFRSKEAASLTIALASKIEPRDQVQTLGTVAATGKTVLPLPAGLDLSIDKTVLLIKDKEVVATAILEPF